MKFKNHYNADEFPKIGEHNRQASATIPDQSMTVRELLQRHVKGLPIQGQKVGFYEPEDYDMPDTRYMDLAEKEELRHEATEELFQIAQKSRQRQYEKRKRFQIEKDKKNPNPASAASAPPAGPPEAKADEKE